MKIASAILVFILSYLRMPFYKFYVILCTLWKMSLLSSVSNIAVQKYNGMLILKTLHTFNDRNWSKNFLVLQPANDSSQFRRKMCFCLTNFDVYRDNSSDSCFVLKRKFERIYSGKLRKERKPRNRRKRKWSRECHKLVDHCIHSEARIPEDDRNRAGVHWSPESPHEISTSPTSSTLGHERPGYHCMWPSIMKRCRPPSLTRHLQLKTNILVRTYVNLYCLMFAN